MPDQQATRRPSFTRLIEELPSTTPFVGPEALERQTEQRFILRLGANESVFGPSPLAREAMRQALDEVALYGDPECFALRSAIAQRESTDIDNISVGAGIDDLLGLVVRSFLEPGDYAVASLGSYPTFAYHVAGYGAHLETCPYVDYRNDLPALAEAAQRRKARVAYLANPDNPTGSYLSGEEIRAFVAALPDDCILLLDEAYGEFAPDDAWAPFHTETPNVIRLRTFSKAYGMAGARVGYVIAAKETVSALDKIRLHFGVNRIGQAGAFAALRDQEYLAKLVAEVSRGRDEYASLARELGLAPLPSAANFVAIDTGAPTIARAVVKTLAERRVFIRMPAAPGLNSLIRITVGAAQDRAELGRILREIWPIATKAMA